ncbi:transcription initiation factor IIA subunit 2-like [Hydractinia symbiolongicarpus]|uniref:transcription initiation factor IIA subunit 2-like n=1 Tax=Hydractinia symbiolongicarpus TaxID=13093 RepID=UPI00254E6C6B|nr:transcription initiation factor IIA subunit 2-like [Hydractinia symbiolongicarpus]
MVEIWQHLNLKPRSCIFLRDFRTCPKWDTHIQGNTMSYQLYRNTTLGNSLQESLDELIQSQQISPQLALQVLLQFDKAINSALATKVKNRINFKGRLNVYRFCDNVWTFVLNNVTFREVGDSIKVDKVKIVACDGKESKGGTDE